MAEWWLTGAAGCWLPGSEGFGSGFASPETFSLFLTYFCHAADSYKPFRKMFNGGIPSLKNLSMKVLAVDIQKGEHDSVSAGRRSGCVSNDPVYMSRKFESFKRINSIRVTNENFDSCNSCKRLGISRLHELHKSKFPFVTRIEFIRSRLSNFSAHVYGVIVDTAAEP